jgi:hypothetical protein
MVDEAPSKIIIGMLYDDSGTIYLSEMIGVRVELAGSLLNRWKALAQN